MAPGTRNLVVRRQRQNKKMEPWGEGVSYPQERVRKWSHKSQVGLRKLQVGGLGSGEEGQL